MGSQRRSNTAAKVASGEQAEAGIRKGVTEFLSQIVGVVPNDTIDARSEGSLDLVPRIWIIGDESVVGGQYLDSFQSVVCFGGGLVY